MRKMETLVLFSPEMTAEMREQTIAALSEVIDREGGKLLAVDQWGMKDLAYPVRKQMRGLNIMHLTSLLQNLNVLSVSKTIFLNSSLFA